MSARRRSIVGAALLLAGLLLSYGLLLLAGALNRRDAALRALDQVGGATGATYYISGDGDDRNAGTSPATAWRSLQPINDRSFEPGSRILLAGGQRFRGPLRLGYDDRGTPARPLVISSYGDDRATIEAGDGDGISMRNTAGLRLERLDIVGAGRSTNHGSGIALVNALAGDVQLTQVTIDQIDLAGFGQHGLLIDGNNGKSGFRDVRITNVAAHDNARSGITVAGEFSGRSGRYAHANLYIGAVRAYNNPGLPGPSRQHSGSGIVISDVDGGTIERSVAFNNGWLCESREGGPVGIWAWDATNITIQFNESYSNRVAGPKDGGGFDLDGGVTSSLLQYNYAHDNDGAGFLLAQFPGARPFGGNIVRYNISADDGRKNGYGGLHFWGPIGELELYNNTVYLTPPASGRPAAVVFAADSVSAAPIRLRNNIFQTTGGLPLVLLPQPWPGVQLQRNAYFTGEQPFAIDWLGTRHPSYAAWQAATGQERLDGRDVGLNVDPELRSPASPPTLGDATRLPTLDGYRLSPTSPLVDAGLDLPRLFQLAPAAHDFYGDPLPQGAAFEIGADEVR